jgi:hypothetical protein
MDRRSFLAAGLTTIGVGALARTNFGAVDRAFAAASTSERRTGTSPP